MAAITSHYRIIYLGMNISLKTVVDETLFRKEYDGRRTSLQLLIIQRSSENTFGILVTHWRIFLTSIRASVRNVEKYVLACLSLHNYLMQTDNAMYTPTGVIDSENRDGRILLGEWRNQMVEHAQSNG